MSSDRKPTYKPHQVPKVCGNCTHIQRYYESPTGYRCTISHERIQDQNITPEGTCSKWSISYWWERRNVKFCNCRFNEPDCKFCRYDREGVEFAKDFMLMLLVGVVMIAILLWAVAGNK